METKLTNEELHKRVYDWVKKLCETGGNAWTLRVPADHEKDTDLLITELINRHKELLSSSQPSEQKPSERVPMTKKQKNQINEKPEVVPSCGEQRQYPHREICGLCNRVSPVGFWVPDEIWKTSVHQSRINDIHCLSCFIERADEKLIDWSKEIKFYPVSLIGHIRDLNIQL